MSVDKRTLIRQMIAKRKKNTPIKSDTVHRPAGLLARSLTSGPLSPAQLRIYALYKMCGPNETAYNQPEVMRCDPPLDIDTVRRLMQQLIHRHDIFRTTFHERDGEVVQTVHRQATFELTEVSLDSKELDNWLGNFVRPFDLTKPCLIRLALVMTPNAQYMAFDSHHIINDGLSLNLMIQELGTMARGETLSAPEFQYLDYVYWMQEQIHSSQYQLHRRYWIEQLQGSLPTLALPTDFPRPSYQDFSGAKLEFRLGTLSASLKSFLQAENITLYAGLLAIYTLFLARLTGQDDFIIGMPVLGRPHSVLRQMPGMFGNTLPIRIKLQNGTGFKEFLKQVKDTTLSSLEHQNCDMSHLVEALNLQRDPSRNALFDTFLVLQVAQLTEFDNPDIRLTPYPFERMRAQLDLTLEIQDHGDDILLKMDYSTALFEPDTVKQFQRQFLQLIENVLHHPEADIAHISLLCEEQRMQMLNWQTPLSKQDLKPISELFEITSERYPDHCAVSHAGQSISYRMLRNKVHTLAHTLHERGVSHGHYVCMLMGRTVDMVVTLLAIIKAGAAYVPIEPDLPEERIRFIIEDCLAHHVITAPGVAERHNWLATLDNVTVISDIHTCQPPPGAQGELAQIQPEDALYVIYTSGTTGQPKGVVVEHRCLLGLLRGNTLPAYDHTDRWSLFHSYAFDVSVFEVFAPLLSGGTLVIVPKDITKNTLLFHQWLQREQITILSQTPSAFYQLIAVDEQVSTDSKLALSTVILAGEALTPGRLRSWHEKYPQTNLINMYGITETTIHTTYKQLHTKDIQAGQGSNIGKSLSSAYIYLLDSHGQLCAPGVSGEIHVGGWGVTREYLHRPQLTNERFITDPFYPERRLYKSGDLAKWTDSGELIYLGRADQQVKIRGYRIECAEVEQQLLKCGDFKAVAVFAHVDEQNSATLCAAVCSEQWSANIQRALRERLQSKMPQYMVPTQIFRVDEIPLTSSGKRNVKRLRNELERQRHCDNANRETSLPQGATEIALAQLWKSCFKLPFVGRLDDFFELGGHSLMAISLLLDIHRTFGRQLSLEALFRNSRLDRMAAQIDAMPIADKIAEIPTIADNSVGFITSSAQQRLFFIEETTRPPGITYNIPLIYHWEGMLDEERLRSALAQLVERHEALRTRFELNEQGELRQRVHGAQKALFWSVRNDVLLTPTQCIGDFVRPFNLRTDMLFRARLVRFHGSDRGLLMLDFHHTICDGLSLNVLIEELNLLYAGSPLEHVTVQYKDYCHWWHHNQQVNKDLDYWVDSLQNAPPLNLFTDFPRPAKQSFSGGEVSLSLESELDQQLQAFCRSHQITPYIAYLSIYSILLSKLSGQEDLVIGSAFAGRPHPNLKHSVGMFVNTLPLRCRPDSRLQLTEYIQRIKQVSAAAQNHQHMDFEKLVNRLTPDKDLSHNPIFDCMLDILPTESTQLRLAPAALKTMALENPTVKTDLMLSIVPGDAAKQKPTQLTLGYATALYRHETAQAIIASFHTLLHHCVTLSDSTLSQLPLVAEGQPVSVVRGPFQPVPADQTVIGLFEAQVKKIPEHIAVCCGARQLTYRELDLQANRLANYLRRHMGVREGDIVVQQLRRSERLIIGLFAILKAGAIYLPLEPDTPMERLQTILQDSRARVLIADDADIHEPCHKTGAGHRVGYLYWDSLPESAELEIAPPVAQVKCDWPAYIIYTSGTTGRPKGVVVGHQALLNLSLWLGDLLYDRSVSSNATQRDITQIARPKTVMLNASIQFDASLQQLVAPLLKGARLVVIDEATRKDPYQLLTEIQNQAVEVADFTPTHLAALLHYVDQNHLSLPLTHVLVGGEPLTRALVQLFYHICGRHSELYNVYGVTEAAVDSTFELIAPTAEQITIGRPLPNRMLCVLDKDGQPMPPLLPGRLHEAGAGLAQGYLHDEVLTQKRFVTMDRGPWADEYQRFFDTGDRAQLTTDGRLVLLGRTDNQVKVRGYRVELDEIRLTLNAAPGIAESLVITHQIDGDLSICAYYRLSSIRPAAGTQIDEDFLKGQLSRRLPVYMIPHYFIELNEFPRNTSGKIAQDNLPCPAKTQGQQTCQVVDDDLARQSASLWRELLGQEMIDLHDNFFAVGGDSIKAIQLASRWRRLGYVLSMDKFFNHPTCAQAANYLLREKSNISQEKVVGPVDLSPIQQTFLEHRFVQEHHWNQAVLLEATAPDNNIDVNHVQRAFASLAEHHDMLRAVLSPDRSSMSINEPGSFVFEVSVFNCKEQEVEEQFNSVQSSLNVQQGPLIKIAIVRTEDRQYLLIVAHHLIIDGVSWRILMEDFLRLYHAGLAGAKQLDLPLKTLSYPAWTQHLQNQASCLINTELDYWRALHIDACDRKQVLDETTSTSVSSSPATDDGFFISSALIEQTVARANQIHGLAINDILLTAFYLAAKQWRNRQILVLNLETHGRGALGDTQDLSRTVGWFTAIFPVRFDIAGDDLEDHLLGVHTILESVPSGGAGFGVLRYLAALSEGDQAHLDQLQPAISFNYLGNIDIGPIDFGTQRSDFESGDGVDAMKLRFSKRTPGENISSLNPLPHDLQLEGVMKGGSLSFVVYFNPSAYTPASIKNLMTLFETQLRQIAIHYERAYTNRKDYEIAQDFSANDLNQEELELIKGALEN